MGYQIEAFLEDGKPALRIYDAMSHKLYLSWNYIEQHESGNQHSPNELKRLFRELILLTCKQDIHNVRIFNAEKIKQCKEY